MLSIHVQERVCGEKEVKPNTAGISGPVQKNVSRLGIVAAATSSKATGGDWAANRCLPAHGVFPVQGARPRMIAFAGRECRRRDWRPPKVQSFRQVSHPRHKHPTSVTLERARPLLGTHVAIRVEARSEAEGHDAIDTAFAEIALIHRLMSFHEAGSDIGRLNENAHEGAVRVHPHTYE